MISIERLSKNFGSTHAVRDVSFTVSKGEIIGLLGPNASGKTTIMRVLTGFFPPTSGHARVAGLDVADQSLALRQKIGYLPESVVLYPDMRVRRFLQFCAEVRGINGGRKRQRVDAMIRDCGLEEVTDRLIGTLSKGYRQRVGLAQALLHQPEVLILDEPTVGLDPRQIIEIRSLIRALRGSTTVLLSTHILPEVSMTCERVVIIDRGRIVAEDTAEGLTRRLQGEDRTLIQVEGPADDVCSVLKTVPGVDHIELTNGAGAATCELIAHSSTGEPVRKALAAAVVNHGWGLIEVRPLAMSLEDLFVRLVTDEEAQNENEKPGTGKRK
ncbi:MAG: ABC transporter ATP-binding protein [Candidatus Binatia bacterium]|jgi:ABC-2 type transport system ATP-binding protein